MNPHEEEKGEIERESRIGVFKIGSVLFNDFLMKCFSNFVHVAGILLFLLRGDPTRDLLMPPFK